MSNASPVLVVTIIWLLTGLSFSFVATRCYVRLFRMRSSLNLSDYLVISGWIAAAVATSVDTRIFLVENFKAVTAHFSAPIPGSAEALERMNELKIVFAGTFFNDVGLYFPKFSLIAFYYHWISVAFPKLRIALHCLTCYVSAACLSAMLTSLLWCNPISQNWSVNPNACGNVKSFEYIGVMWSLNISSDVFIFTLPFFLLPNLRLQKRNFYGAMVIFLLGAITIATTTIRFIAYKVIGDVGVIYILFLIEFNTSIIVTCLPSLKVFLNSGSCICRAKSISTSCKGSSITNRSSSAAAVLS